MWVYSEPGKGSTFKIYLPRVEEVVETEKIVTEKEIPRGGETVLVAEDERDVRILAIQILKRQGYKILEAANGGEALLICEKHRGEIHLMLTDIVMPGMSGRELAERLLQLHPEMKVLYMSGYPYHAVMRHGILGEEPNFIQKPFSLQALVNKVREVLDQKER
jgi:two-component system cell cycle sensor histidine kinase/response regulator CckA